jgi:Na+/H+-dicarboxylate symporter
MTLTQRRTSTAVTKLAAVGAAGIPEAGLVTIIMVLTAVDLPTDGIGLLLSVDWFLDRLRTVCNVVGDSIGAGIVDELEKRAARQKRQQQLYHEDYEEIVDKKQHDQNDEESEDTEEQLEQKAVEGAGEFDVRLRLTS